MPVTIKPTPEKAGKNQDSPVRSLGELLRVTSIARVDSPPYDVRESTPKMEDSSSPVLVSLNDPLLSTDTGDSASNEIVGREIPESTPKMKSTLTSGLNSQKNPATSTPPLLTKLRIEPKDPQTILPQQSTPAATPERFLVSVAMISLQYSQSYLLSSVE
jgi:hypothetical protein